MTAISAKLCNGVMAKKGRIVFVTLSLDVGGAERQIAAIAPVLVSRGWPVTVFCFNRGGALADQVRAAGVNVIMPPIAAKGRETPRAVRAALSAIAAVRLGFTVHRPKPAIMHFFLTEPYLFGGPAAIAARAPIRIMSRRESNNVQPGMAHVRRFEAKLHPHMTAILANSHRVIADLESEGCRPNRLGLIYNGVDLNAFSQASDRTSVRRTLGIADDELALAMIANLIAYKGHSDLLKAFADAKAATGAKLKLLLIGQDDGSQADLQAEAASLGIKENVAFLGSRTDVASILRASDIGVHASHTEGFSNAVIEGMAAGLPMVVTNVGGSAEAVIEGKQGIVVPPHAPRRLGAALTVLVRDPALRAIYSSAARKRVVERFSLPAVVDRYEALYLGLIAGKLPCDIPEVSLDQD